MTMRACVRARIEASNREGVVRVVVEFRSVTRAKSGVSPRRKDSDFGSLAYV